MDKRRKEEDLIFRKRSEAIFEQTPAILFDKTGKIRELNTAAAAALGVAANSIIGKTLKQAGMTVTDQFNRRLAVRSQPWHKASDTRAIVQNAITCITDRDGRISWQQSTSVPLQKSEKAKPYGILSVFTDISHLMELQAKAVQSQKMDATASLASGLTHDFNNILTSIRTAVQLLLMDTPDSDPRTEALKDIENEALRGAELIRQLLLFTAPENGRKEKTHICHHITSLRRLVRRTLPRNIHLHYNLSDQEFACAITPANFEQIFINLVINARDAMTSGGTLTVSTSATHLNSAMQVSSGSNRRRTAVRIDITDTGEGMPQEIINRIFEPFFTTKKNSGGTGLGLSIVHNLVTKAGGSISVESAPSRGTVFSVTLPAAKTRRIHSREETHHETSPVCGFETILLVDDEPLITKSTARFLERYGYKALTAFDGHSAVDIFSQNMDSIAIVLLDMEMPGLSGRQCLERIRIMRPSQKIIMLSGHILKTGDWNPVEAGANLFVQKPFDSAFLLHEIRHLIDKTP